MTMRKMSFDAAVRSFAHRFTMQHVPSWALTPCQVGWYYAPQFASDQDWYDHTKFKGEHELASGSHCYTPTAVFPIGKWLTRPFVPSEWDGVRYIGDGAAPVHPEGAVPPAQYDVAKDKVTEVVRITERLLDRAIAQDSHTTCVAMPVEELRVLIEAAKKGVRK